jgi:hypothetical protein
MKIVFNILFCLLLVTACSAQRVGLSLTDIKAPPQYVPSFLLKKTVQKADIQYVAPQIPRQIPLVFCAETLPFFCKIEHKMGLNQRFPLKFRLGDVQYVDEMEGKRKPIDH